MHAKQRLYPRAAFDAEAILSDPERAASSAYVRRLSGILRALGYPERWQREVIGWDFLATPERRETAHPRAVEALLGLLAHVGDRWATPRNCGCTAEEIEATQQQASRSHHYPPAAYDELFDRIEDAVVPRGMRGTSRRGKGAEAAVRDLTVLYLRVTQHLSSAVIGEQLRISSRTVDRACRDVGLRSSPQRLANGREYLIIPQPGQGELIARIQQAYIEATHDPEGAHEVWTALVAWALPATGSADGQVAA